MDLPIVVPSLRGMLTKTGSGMSSNLVGAAKGRVSLVFFTMARIMSLKADAGPNSVPPILSTICFETDFT